MLPLRWHAADLRRFTQKVPLLFVPTVKQTLVHPHLLTFISPIMSPVIAVVSHSLSCCPPTLAPPCLHLVHIFRITCSPLVYDAPPVLGKVRRTVLLPSASWFTTWQKLAKLRVKSTIFSRIFCGNKVFTSRLSIPSSLLYLIIYIGYCMFSRTKQVEVLFLFDRIGVLWLQWKLFWGKISNKLDYSIQWEAITSRVI